MLGCGAMVLYPFVYFAMVDSGVFALLAVAIVLSGPVHDLQFAPQAAFIAETFPGSRRYSGVSLGYQLASITAGGPAPIVALYLFETFRTSTAIRAMASVAHGPRARRTPPGGGAGTARRARDRGGPERGPPICAVQRSEARGGSFR